MAALMAFVAYLQTRTADERGQGLAEYALILALVAVVAVASLTVLGGDIATAIDNVKAAL